MSNPRKTTTKKTTSKTSAKKAPAKKTPRMSASAARAEGAAKMKRAASGSKPKASKSPEAKPATKREPKPERVSGLDLAAKVLADARRPLPVKDITELVLAAGWVTNGKTPESTLYAAIIREIAKKGKDARFAKHARGLFTATSAKGA